MRNIKACTAALAYSIALLSTSVHAAPIVWDYTLEDNYTGCRFVDSNGDGDKDCGSSWSSRDVIGHLDLFDIDRVEVERDTNGILTVDIFNTLVGDSGKKYSSYTRNPTKPDENTGIGYGDLFLSDFSASNPYTGQLEADGTIGASSKNDHHGNGHQWTHALGFEQFDDRYTDNTQGGNLFLYTLAPTDFENNLFLTEDFMRGATYRSGQEVAVNPDATGIMKTLLGTWDIEEHVGVTAAGDDLGKLTFQIDVTGTALQSWTGLALKWGFTCANDSIEAFDNNNVPEPAVVALLGMGLLGVGVTRRRRA